MTSRAGNFQSDRIAAAGSPVGTDAPPDRDVALLSDLLHADRVSADAGALADGTDELTYGEYSQRVGQLAAVLVDLGTRPGDRVGVHLRKSVFSFVAVHAVIRAGGVMVPLDSLAPAEHLATVIADADIEVLITDGRPPVLAELAASGLRALVIRSKKAVTIPEVNVASWDQLDAVSPIDAVRVDPDDPAYIIYTSGSTGTPKGIVHTHRSALAYARLAARTYELTVDDRLANVASLHFDQSTFELYAAPLVGCSVTVVPDAVLRFPASVSELIERHRVTVWYSVPYILRQLTTRGALEQRDLSSLRWVLYGGESYPPDELAQLMAFVPTAAVSNVYGPAEVNQCMYFHLTEPPHGIEVVPIGVAWDDTELAVLDADGVPVADQAGELLVASSTMMAGYWNRPDLTGAAIVERSIPGTSATRWYRTGDLVQWAGDDLVFLGRADNQVKLRGQRIELEAIDLTIRTLDNVGEVAVVVETLTGGERQLVAVVEVAVVEVAADDGVTLADVQAVVAARHPRVAVPADLIVVPALARTGTDKIDRNAALDLLLATRAG